MRRFPNALMIWIVCIVFAAGCSTTGSNSGVEPTNVPPKNEPASTDTKQTPEPGPEPANKEPIDIIIYSDTGTNVDPFWVRYGDFLKEKFPEYNFIYLSKYAEATKNMEAMITTNTKFDIYFAGSSTYVSRMTKYGLAYDMTDLIKKHDIDLTKVNPAHMSTMNSNSKFGMFGIPVHTEYLALFYNKDLFNRFGVEYPKQGMTWEEFYDLAAKFNRNEDGIQYAGYRPSIGYFITRNALSIPLIDEKTGQPTINKDPRWATLFNTLYTKAKDIPGMSNYINSTKAGVNANFYTEQTLAMAITTSNLIINQSVVDQMNSFDWDIISMPTFQSAPGLAANSTPMYFGVTSFSEKKDDAMRVVGALISAEAQKHLAEIGFVPVVQDTDVMKAMGQKTGAKDRNWAALLETQVADIPYEDILNPEVSSVYTKYANQVFAGETDVNTALRMAEEEAIKILEELR